MKGSYTRMRIHHIGYLVDNIEVAAKEFEMLGFFGKGGACKDLIREAYIMFLYGAGGYAIELIQPLNEMSPLYGLRKKYRNSPYHVCYETDDLTGEIERLTSVAGGGCTLIQPPQLAPAIEGSPDVAFLMNRHIGIIELVELK
jgi:methylmalonyl-CoA/ethylmalonyl-CoA epimerase